MLGLTKTVILVTAFCCVSAFRKISFNSGANARCLSTGDPCADDGQCCKGSFCLKMHSSNTGMCAVSNDNTYSGLLDQPCSDDSDCPSIDGVCCRQVSRYRVGMKRRCSFYRDQAKECTAH